MFRSQIGGQTKVHFYRYLLCFFRNRITNKTLLSQFYSKLGHSQAYHLLLFTFLKKIVKIEVLKCVGNSFSVLPLIDTNTNGFFNISDEINIRDFRKSNKRFFKYSENSLKKVVNCEYILKYEIDFKQISM